VLLAAAGVLAAAGCGSPKPSPARPASAGPASSGPASSGPASSGPASSALDFRGRTLDGTAFDASTLRGRPAILWFWAPWCATCASEAQSIADLADEYRGRIGILGIAGMGDTKAMHRFVSDFDIGGVPHLDDQAGELWRRFRITQQSTYVFVDRTGRIVKTGYLDDLALTAEIKHLVAA
jgi:thiol-disulfide isomerase/thioredoxin